MKITEQGDSEFAVGTIVPKDTLEQANAQIEALGGTPAKGAKPKPATASTQLLGITKAAVQSSSFISAASFQETTKVLTEAALAGKVDYLVGLKENVILGHLIPAGTGFRTYQDSEVRFRPEALEALTREREPEVVQRFPLLEEGNGEKKTQAPAAAPAGTALDQLLGGAKGRVARRRDEARLLGEAGLLRAAPPGSRRWGAAGRRRRALQVDRHIDLQARPQHPLLVLGGLSTSAHTR